MKSLESFIRNVPDFPVKGIQFKDITTLLKNGELLAQAVDQMYDPFRELEIDKIVGIEARGFIFGSALAYKLNLGFIPIRKPGKLPAEVETEEYNLEYGQDSIEMHRDAIEEGEKILIVDDLLATGGTAAAAARLIDKLGGEVVGFSFLIELTELKARSLLKNYKVYSLMQFPF
ncbi:MAG: adenine phosphoribosyltransferase [bacterium]|nr:MAG: adenine phosphoribosyltransferase [bacterium]